MLGLVNLLLILLLASPVQAASLRVEWSPNTEPDLAGYNIFWGTATGIYSQTATVRPEATGFWLDGLDPATTYCVALSAFDQAGNESGLSEEVSAETSALGEIIGLSLVSIEAEVSPGGSLSYWVRLANTSTRPESFEFWTTLILPDGRQKEGALIRPRQVSLEGGQQMTRSVSHRVPTWQPPGTYVYQAHLGRYPVAEVSTFFVFTIMP